MFDKYKHTKKNNMMQSNLQLAKNPPPSTPVTLQDVDTGDAGLSGSNTDNNDNASNNNTISSRHNSFVTPETNTPCTNNVDFIGPSKAVKHLFSLPYSTDKNVSVALHNMGNGTLLLDSGEDVVGGSGGYVVGASSSEQQQQGTTSCFGTNKRRGRRRQRPSSWSSNTIQDDDDDEEEEAVDDNDDMKNQLQLSQLNEGEQSLLASLSLLLEEEKKSHRTTAKQLLQESSSNNVHDDRQDGSINEHANNAIIVPSNKSIIIKQTSGDINTTKSTNCNDNVHQDPLNNNDDTTNHHHLHPPQHYLSHAVSPPTEPRQYVNWQFHNMKLLVASDAVIYKNNPNDNVDATEHANNNEEHTNCAGGGGGGGGGESIAIRVADLSDLKSQMNYHEHMVKDERLFIQGGRQQEDDRRALPPSSYAEALLKGEEEEEEDVSKEDGMDNVKLQTCIIPATGVAAGHDHLLANLGFFHSSECPPPAPSQTDHTQESYDGSSSPLPFSSTPVCTVLDTYLDNLMTNVPQLALILREAGFIQNIKLLRTEDIPSLMMHPSTLGGCDVDDDSTSSAQPPMIFSPEIVEMNAAMLLRFLKTNCTRENSTYLLHRNAGETNIQLFDISNISEMRQRRKWVWWLSLCSYRFACRLEQLQHALSPQEKATRREYRNRQRSLLHNTLSLLEELADMDGGRHETIGAAVCEHLADTFLWNDDADGDVGARDASKPTPCASSSQPYGNVTVDCLDKAHDHLMNGIKKLTPLLVKAKARKDDSSTIEIEALSTQLYGIHHKIVNVNLRLANHHLQNYFSSNLVQSLRTAGRNLSDAASLLDVLNNQVENVGTSFFSRRVILQHAWLWEYCGHFARSFAADDLWRDRGGGISGEDLIGLFREVNASCEGIIKQCFGATKRRPKTTSVCAASHGQVSLKSLSGIVILPHDFEEITASVLQKEGCHEAILAAKTILDQKTQIKRDARLVLVAASVCYGISIDSFLFLQDGEDVDTNEASLTSPQKKSINNDFLLSDGTVAPLLRQRLGDACNEIGKVLLSESRAVLLPQFSPPKSTGGIFDMSHVSAIMLASAQFWFNEGLEQFTEGNDLRNLALLRCNLCQCAKIRANTNVILPGTSQEESRKNNSESHLQDAVDHLVSAHEAMGQRDADPQTWDMVSEELAATLLVLGVRRRQSALSVSSATLLFNTLRLTPGVEKAIVEPMERSCQIYEALGTARASHQAAAAHYQLALYFSKVWTCQRDEVKTRDKLAAAFRHYGKAHQYFFNHIKGNETTFILLSLDFSSLYSAVSGEECLTKALSCCLDTYTAFSVKVAPAATDEQMKILEENVESRVSKLLLNLVKIEKENSSKLKGKQKPSDKYKTMYRKVLEYKTSSSGKVESNSNGDGIEENPSYPIFKLLKALNDLSKV